MKIGVITGASSGIGRCFAKELDKKGLDCLWLIARREGRLAELSEELKTPVKIMPLDLLKKESFERYADELSRHKPTVSYLVNCAGGYSGRIAAMAGDGFIEIIPRAGEYLLLDKAEGSRVSHTIFQVPGKEGKGILVTPTVDGNLLTGPTAVPVAAPDCTETTAAGLETVAKLAAKSVPGVNFRQVITSFAGVRSSEKHGDFIIRASETVPNLVHVAAIDSPGLTCCAAIAKMTVGILRDLGARLEEKPDWNGTREDPHAFRKMSDEEKNAYIKAHPAYGKIVCRCETVSEGEILDAIRRAPRALDLDGVKRRTRSGMGRCQGGFCSPYIMKLLSQELHIPMEEVTKSGSGSEPLVGRL